MAKKLIATDYDGTFCRGGEISAEDREAVSAWRAAGGLFGFVTGRSDDFFRTIREKSLEADFLLLYNGALLALPDGAVIREYRIEPAVFAALAGFFRARPDVCEHDEPDGSPYYRQYYARCTDEACALRAAEEANRRFGDAVTAFVNGPFVNIGKKGSGKTQGVYDALRYYGLPDGAQAVFGDDYNDLDMIVRHRGWAVETARPAVLAQAPHVCGSVGGAIRAFLRGEE